MTIRAIWCESRKAHVRPGLAGVDGLVDAVAGVRAPGAVGLARPDPDDVRVGRGHGHIADRELRLAVEDRLEGRPVVDRLPDAAVPRPDVERVEMIAGRGVRHGEARHPGPGPEGAEGPASEALEKIFGDPVRRSAGQTRPKE